MDVKIRFDSTLRIFELVLFNQSVLQFMQECGRRDESFWPIASHFHSHDWVLIQNIVSILASERGATEASSTKSG